MDEQGAIEYRLTPEYLQATVIGPRTREFVSRFCREIPERCAQLGCRRLLIEMRLEGEPVHSSTFFDLVRYFIAEVKRQRDPISEVALVGPFRDIPRLAEMASANRAVKIAGFTDLSAAENWLQGGGGSEPPAAQRGV